MTNLKMWDKEYGIASYHGKPVVGSRRIAQIFEKRHDNVLRDIQHITDPQNGLSESFTHLNFEFSEYKDSTGRKLPEYLLTKDGFTMLAMGFTGRRALQFKAAYIQRFNEMEKYISFLDNARMEFPELTQAIYETHEIPKMYHFTNEMDMINILVLGMKAKDYKEIHGLGDVPSIRPYLSAQEIHDIRVLQKVDIGLVLSEPNFFKRRKTLEWYYNRLRQKQISA